MSVPRRGGRLPNRALERQSTRRSVINYIKELIFDGKLRAGDRVPQDEVARALGLSNTPVREAFIALEHEDLVTIELHRGAFVNAFHEESIRTQYELFGLNFAWAIRRLMTRITPGVIEQLNEIAIKTKDADPAEMYELMSEFTRILQSEAGSREWGRIINTLQPIVPRHAFYEKVPGALEGARQSFEPLVRAIERGDVDEAVTWVERWNYRHGEVLIEELQRRGLFATAETSP